MHRHVLVLATLQGCSKSDVPVEERGQRPSSADPLGEIVKGVVVTAKDVTVDGASIGTLPEKLMADRVSLVALLGKHVGDAIALAYSEDAPAEVVLAALRGIDDAVKSRIMVETVVGGKLVDVCRPLVPPAIDPTEERVDLSVELGEKQWVVGMSRVNEFTVLDRPFTRFESTLKEHKASAFFADSQAIEVAAAPGLTGADLTPALTLICSSGFVAIRPRAIAELTAHANAEHGPIGVPAAVHHLAPTASIGQPSVQGDLDKAIIRRYIRRNLDKVTYCYEKALLARPTLAGTVATQFVIGVDGIVSSSAASGVDPDVSTCVAGVIKTIEFPKPKGNGIVQVSYPFTFRPTGQ